MFLKHGHTAFDIRMLSAIVSMRVCMCFLIFDGQVSLCSIVSTEISSWLRMHIDMCSYVLVCKLCSYVLVCKYRYVSCVLMCGYVSTGM